MNRIQLDRWKTSSKIEALLEELSNIRDARPAFDTCSQSPGSAAPASAAAASIKCIVFSQFVSFLDIIEWRLQRAGFRTVKLDGTMTPQQRDLIIEAFTTNPRVQVFLISLKAGGVALNLTEASHVFLMDPWWNPAVEAQAMDRIHRLGQYRPIQIKRLIVENSIEARIVQLQEKKNLMFQSTVGMDVDALSRLTLEDLNFLFVM